MGAIWSRLCIAAFLAAGPSSTQARADELPPLLTPDKPPIPIRADASPKRRIDAAVVKATAPPESELKADPPRPADETKPAPSQTASKETPAKVATPTETDLEVQKMDPAAARAETKERLVALPANGDKAATPATRALREALEERLTWLDAIDMISLDRAKAEKPEPSPEKIAAENKAELERAKAMLALSAKDPDSLVPAEFRSMPEPVPQKAQEDLKEAIEASQSEVKERAGKLEQFRAELSRKPAVSQASLRATRDKAFQRLSAVLARNVERTAALESGTTEARDLARERLINGAWEGRVEAERLKLQEALLSLEDRKAPLPSLNGQLLEAQLAVSKKVLDRLQSKYRTIASRQENDLKKQAVAEQNRSKAAVSPVERYRAKRSAELLELEARVVKSENALTTNAPPSLEEQKALADRAETDFNSIRHLLDDGKVSHLDALRLNNDFKRLGAERSRIVNNELAIAAGRLTAAENAISSVEMEIIFDGRDDRYELENLLETLPKKEHANAWTVFDEMERKHSALLSRRREALQKLAARAEQTHEQILRRLRILDDHFGFIRTNLFWVRDEEPLGPSTVVQARREFQQLTKAVAKVGAEVVERSQWGRVSPEFVAASVGLVVLPWPLYRLKRLLRAFGRVPRRRRHLPTVVPPSSAV